MFSFSCPSCQQSISAQSDRVGQPSICPKCLKPAQIPERSSDNHSPNAYQTELAAVAIQDSLDADPNITTPMPRDLIAAKRLSQSHSHEELSQTLMSGSKMMGTENSSDTLHSTPRPNTQAVFSRKAISPDDQSGQVVLNPTGLFAVDVAAELSAALSMRMAPPPLPVSDLRFTMFGWLIGTFLALSCWVIGVAENPTWFRFVALVGIGMVIFAVLWRAYISNLRGKWFQGLMALIPPLSLIQLFRRTSSHGLRPLRFAITGGVLLGLYAAGPTAHQWLNQRMGLANANDPVFQNQPDSAAGKIQQYVQLQRWDKLPGLIEVLSTPEKRQVASEEDVQELSKAVLSLTDHERSAVRQAARKCYAEWAPRQAQELLPKWLEDPSTQDRRVVLRFAANLANAKVADAVAEILDDREVREDAKRVLIEMGEVAENPTILKLYSTKEGVVIAASDVLVKIGGTKSIEALQKLIEITPLPIMKIEAKLRLASIEARLNQPSQD